jgi:NAD(P)-dependent dehydrogenase (short-subunit alcohol dehydrogenase family)
LARSPDRIRALEQELTDTHAMICDVSNESQVAEVVAHVRNRYGSPNVLIHNAVGGGWGTFLEIEPKMLDRNFQVNVMGLLYLAREVAPDMIKAGSSTILVTGNTSAVRGKANAARPRSDADSASVVGMLTVSSLVSRVEWSPATRAPRSLDPAAERPECVANLSAENLGLLPCRELPAGLGLVKVE